MMNQELEDQLYAQVAREMAGNIYHPAPMARAAEKAAGNADLAKSLYIKFRVEQLAREVEQEALRQQLESEQNARIAAEQRRQQAIAETKRVTVSFLKRTGKIVNKTFLIAFIVLGIFLLFISIIIFFIVQK